MSKNNSINPRKKLKKKMNKPKYDRKIKVIHAEIDRWTNTTRKISLFKSIQTLNIILSVPGGAGFIILGAFHTNSLIFYGGFILFLQGIIIFPLAIMLRSTIKNVTLRKTKKLQY